MDAVHEADLEVWRAIDHGERQIDWEAWFGHPDGADYLTPEGKQARQRAVTDLTAFFEPKWPDQALQPHPGQGQRIEGIGVSAPILLPLRSGGPLSTSSRSAGGQACNSWQRTRSRATKQSAGMFAAT